MQFTVQLAAVDSATVDLINQFDEMVCQEPSVKALWLDSVQVWSNSKGEPFAYTLIYRQPQRTSFRAPAVRMHVPLDEHEPILEYHTQTKLNMDLRPMTGYCRTLWYNRLCEPHVWVVLTNTPYNFKNIRPSRFNRRILAQAER
jgi:hypothetical protein